MAQQERSDLETRTDVNAVDYIAAIRHFKEGSEMHDHVAGVAKEVGQFDLKNGGRQFL